MEAGGLHSTPLLMKAVASELALQEAECDRPGSNEHAQVVLVCLAKVAARWSLFRRKLGSMAALMMVEAWHWMEWKACCAVVAEG